MSCSSVGLGDERQSTRFESAGRWVVAAAIATLLSCIIATNGLGAPVLLSQPTTVPANPIDEVKACLRRARAAADEVTFELHLSNAYRAIAEVQLKLGDTDQARAILLEARRVVDGYSDPSPQAQELACIARAQESAGDGAAARRTLEDASGSASRDFSASRRCFWYSWVAREQVWAGDLDGAAASWKAAEREAEQDAGDQNFDYARIAEDMATAKRAEDVQRTLRKIKADRVGASITYRQVAEAQAYVGDVRGARQTLRLVPDLKEADDALAAIAEAQGRAGDINGALATARSIQAGAYNRDAALESIAATQADRGEIDGAIATTKGIEDVGLLAEARDHVATRQIRVHDPAAQATIAAIAKAVETLDQPREQAETLCAVASLQRASGDRDGARKSLKKARIITDKLDGSDGIQGGWNGKWGLLGRLASERAALGDFAEAKATAATLPDAFGDRDRTTACRAIAAAQVSAGDLAGVEQWIKSIKSDYDRAFAWVGVAETLYAQAQSRKPGKN